MLGEMVRIDDLASPISQQDLVSMRSFYDLRLGRRQWKLIPLPALKCGAISLCVVLTALFVLDRVVLPGLERQGLTAGANWARHNALVIAEHQLADTTVAFPESASTPVPAGIRSWVGQPVDIEKVGRTKRILVMGDSFVWGSPYLTLNHMWWRQLDQLLEENSVEVIALGRPGASTRNQLQWLRYFQPTYQPDLIIWGYVNNDADEGLVRQISISQQSIPKMDRVRSAARGVWPRVMAKFDGLRSNKLAKMFTGPEYGYDYPEWELKLIEPDNLAAYAKTVGEVKAFLDEVRIPSFMMTLPNFPSTEYFSPRNAPILKIWRDAGIDAYDTVPEFVRRYGETPLSGNETIRWGINPADGHPGPQTCRFLAEQAAEIVRRDFPQFLGEALKLSSNPVINDWLPNQQPDSRPRQIDHRQEWRMTYPPDESRCPTMPLGIPTPLMAFERPIPLSSLKLVGPSLTTAQVWVTCLDENEHYDDGELHDLGEQRGAELVWTMPRKLATRPVSVIRFRAAFSTTNREMTWAFRTRVMEAE